MADQPSDGEPGVIWRPRPRPWPKPNLLQRLVMDPWRRRTCLAMVLCGVLVAGITIAADHNPQGYVCQASLAHPFIGVFIALAMATYAAHLGLPRKLLRVIALWVLGLAMAGVACLGVAVAAFESSFEPSSGGPVVGESGRFKVVKYTYPGFFNSGAIGLRIQTRDGLLSREGKDDVACFAVPASEAGDEWLLGSVRFINDTTLAVTAKDGTFWTVSFDPATLKPNQMLDHCSDAPDVAAD